MVSGQVTADQDVHITYPHVPGDCMQTQDIHRTYKQKQSCLCSLWGGDCLCWLPHSSLKMWMFQPHPRQWCHGRKVFSPLSGSVLSWKTPLITRWGLFLSSVSRWGNSWKYKISQVSWNKRALCVWNLWPEENTIIRSIVMLFIY